MRRLSRAGRARRQRLDERAHVVVGGAEVDEARPQADLPVDRRRGDPDAPVILERPHEPGVVGVRVVRPMPTWRNGTIESGGGPQSGSSASCSTTSS